MNENLINITRQSNECQLNYKAIALKFASLIAFCINIAIMTCIYPAELLRGRLKLIHKNGDTDIENFRFATFYAMNGRSLRNSEKIYISTLHIN